MDKIDSLKRRATDLVQSLPQNLPALPRRLTGPKHPTMKGTWEKIDVPLLPRSSHSVNVVGASAFIFGGEIKPREPVGNDVHVVTLPSSGAGSDYYSIKAKPSKPPLAEEEQGRESEKPKAKAPQVQPTSRSEDESTSGEDSEESEEDHSSEDDSDEDDSDEDASESEVEEKSQKTSTPQDKGKAVAVEEPLRTCVPVSRVGHATAVIGTRILMFGGRGGPDMTPLDEGGRVWVFETKSHVWTALDPREGTRVPPPRSYHAAASVDMPREFFRSGHGSARKPGVTWLDWAKGDSDRVGIPQDPVVGVVSAEATDEEDAGYGTFFIHGGCLAGQGQRAKDVWAFDVRSKTWQELPSAPGKPRGGAAMAVSKSRIYRFGGFNGETQEGGQLDVLEVGVSALDDGSRTTAAPGEDTVSAKGTWHSIHPAPPAAVPSSPAGATEPFPAARSVASMCAVTLGGGTEYLVLMLGEVEASTQGHAGAGRFHDDVWAFQVPPVSMTSASVGEAFRAAFGGGRNSDGRWFPVETRAYDEEGKGRGEDIGPGARGWMASAFMGDVEGSGVFVWGGLDENNRRLGDGYIFRLD